MRHPEGNVAQAAPSGRVLVLAGGKSSSRGRPESAEWRGRSCHCGEGGLWAELGWCGEGAVQKKLPTWKRLTMSRGQDVKQTLFLI